MMIASVVWIVFACASNAHRLHFTRQEFQDSATEGISTASPSSLLPQRRPLSSIVLEPSKDLAMTLLALNPAMRQQVAWRPSATSHSDFLERHARTGDPLLMEQEHAPPQSHENASAESTEKGRPRVLARFVQRILGRTRAKDAKTALVEAKMLEEERIIALIRVLKNETANAGARFAEAVAMTKMEPASIMNKEEMPGIEIEVTEMEAETLNIENTSFQELEKAIVAEIEAESKAWDAVKRAESKIQEAAMQSESRAREAAIIAAEAKATAEQKTIETREAIADRAKAAKEAKVAKEAQVLAESRAQEEHERLLSAEQAKVAAEERAALEARNAELALEAKSIAEEKAAMAEAQFGQEKAALAAREIEIALEAKSIAAEKIASAEAEFEKERNEAQAKILALEQELSAARKLLPEGEAKAEQDVALMTSMEVAPGDSEHRSSFSEQDIGPKTQDAREAKATSGQFELPELKIPRFENSIQRVRSLFETSGKESQPSVDGTISKEIDAKSIALQRMYDDASGDNEKRSPTAGEELGANSQDATEAKETSTQFELPKLKIPRFESAMQRVRSFFDSSGKESQPSGDGMTSEEIAERLALLRARRDELKEIIEEEEAEESTAIEENGVVDLGAALSEDSLVAARRVKIRLPEDVEPGQIIFAAFAGNWEVKFVAPDNAASGTEIEMDVMIRHAGNTIDASVAAIDDDYEDDSVTRRVDIRLPQDAHSGQRRSIKLPGNWRTVYTVPMGASPGTVIRMNMELHAVRVGTSGP